MTMSVSLVWAATGDVIGIFRPTPIRDGVRRDLPPGLSDFGEVRNGAVVVRGPGESLMPIRAAIDWCQDRGWEIFPAMSDEDRESVGLL